MDVGLAAGERWTGPGTQPGQEPAEAPDVMAPWAWIWMLIWITALLVAVWLVVRAPSPRAPTAEEALAILRVRFARGEITQAEFEQARNTLLDDEERST